ncbi:hypothetical protein [Bradyrhizobium sp. USDA 10063]
MALSDHWRWVSTPEVSANFLEGDFKLPAADEPGEDVVRLGVEVGGEECLRFEFTDRITDEEPTDGQRLDAASIPEGGTGSDLDDAIGSAVPEADVAALPADLAILDDCGQLLLRLAFDRRPTAALALWRREVEQVGVHPQAGDDADTAVNGGEEFDGRKRTVSDEHDIASRKPATDLQDGLAGPVEQGLGLSRSASIEAFGRGQQGQKGQRHDAVGPRHAHQQHGGQPAQTAGLDEMPARSRRS